MKKIIFISLVFFVILSAQDKKLTLEESLQIGLGNSRQIKISESLLRSSDEKVTEYASQMLPKLSLSAGYTYMNLNEPTEIGLGPFPTPVKIRSIFMECSSQFSSRYLQDFNFHH